MKHIEKIAEAAMKAALEERKWMSKQIDKCIPAWQKKLMALDKTKTLKKLFGWTTVIKISYNPKTRGVTRTLSFVKHKKVYAQKIFKNTLPAQSRRK